MALDRRFGFAGAAAALIEPTPSPAQSPQAHADLVVSPRRACQRAQSVGPAGPREVTLARVPPPKEESRSIASSASRHSSRACNVEV